MSFPDDLNKKIAAAVFSLNRAGRDKYREWSNDDTFNGTIELYVKAMPKGFLGDEEPCCVEKLVNPNLDLDMDLVQETLAKSLRLDGALQAEAKELIVQLETSAPGGYLAEMMQAIDDQPNLSVYQIFHETVEGPHGGGGGLFVQSAEFEDAHGTHGSGGGLLEIKGDGTAKD